MRLILAPMQGLVDDVMRILLTDIGGFDACVSEFVRITHTVHSKPTWLKHAPELAHNSLTPSGVPCVVQLLGSDAPNMLANALNVVDYGAQQIDLNFGCPAPTVNKHKGGAVLLKEPEAIYDIVRTLRQGLPDHIALTAKMRLGYEDKALAIECAQAIEAGGAAELVVHARTKVEGYTPPAHWIWIRKIAQAISIPVTANGDVFTLADYVQIKQETGCASVMLGRGALMRPDLARRIKTYEAGTPIDEVAEADWAQINAWLIEFVHLCVAKTGSDSKYPAARFKQWLGMLKLVHPQAAALFGQIKTLKQAEDILAVLQAQA
ncbi:tRNA dihydrouridine synthase [Neisseriaceae bacterium CLB008]